MTSKIFAWTAVCGVAAALTLGTMGPALAGDRDDNAHRRDNHHDSRYHRNWNNGQHRGDNQARYHRSNNSDGSNGRYNQNRSDWSNGRYNQNRQRDHKYDRSHDDNHR